jgi:branched-chain amino acid transport system permease protein
MTVAARSPAGWVAVALTVVALGLPFVISQFWLFVVVEVLVFALYAVSFNVLLGYGGMLSFGHAAFFGVGGYAVAILMAKATLPLVVAFVLAPLLAAMVAAVVGFFAVRRTGIYFAMLTFAFQMLLYTIAMKATPLTGGDDGISGLKPAGPLGNSVAYYFFTLVLVVAAFYVLSRVVESPFGYTLRALRGNARRAQYAGVDVRSHQLAAFVLTGAFAGLAGALFALSSGNVYPTWINWTASATPIVMAVLGGIRTFLGPVVGAAVYVLLEVVISGKTEYWPLVMGAIIIVLVLLLPDGLTGMGRRLRGG